MKYIDMHCDTISKLFMNGGNLKSNDMHVDLNKLKKGECLLQNFAVFTDLKYHDSSFTYNVIDFYHKQMEENKNIIKPIINYSDIVKNENNNLISAMLTLEEGSVIDGDLNNLKRFYDLGVRMITLTWNYPNSIGYPNINCSNTNHSINDFNVSDGLTDFGIEFVRKCNELGIIVDVSHASDKVFYDVLKYSNKPFVASHSNSRFICKVGRNLTDQMIEDLADRGGVLGLNFCSAFVQNGNELCTTIDKLVEHIKHIVNVGGIDCIGIGTDFDGIKNSLEFKNASGMQLLCESLKGCFSNDELEKIFYKNVLRVYKDCLE